MLFQTFELLLFFTTLLNYFINEDNQIIFIYVT